MRNNTIVLSHYALLHTRAAHVIQILSMAKAIGKLNENVVLVFPYAKRIGFKKTMQIILSRYGNIDNVKFLGVPFFNSRVFSQVVYLFCLLVIIIIYKPKMVYGRYLYGCLLSSVLKVNTIYESHAPSHFNSIVASSAAKSLVNSKYLNKLVVISQALKNKYSKTYYNNKNKILVSPDGSFDDGYKLGLTKSFSTPPKVCYAGSFTTGKGVDTIVNLAKTYHYPDYYAIGGTTKQISFYKTICNSINYLENVKYKDIKHLLAKMDILLLPLDNIVFGYNSKENIAKYTSPLKMFDYMSMRKPILAADAQVLREVLINDYNCILVQNNNIGMWIEAINKVIVSSDYREKISRNAYSDFIKYYTWDIRTEKIFRNMY